MLTLQFSLFPLLSYLVYTNQPLKKKMLPGVRVVQHQACLILRRDTLDWVQLDIWVIHGMPT